MERGDRDDADHLSYRCKFSYLSWTAVEQLKNGAAVDLREIPAIIGGDQKSRHGVVLAKSPAAKRYGIRTGEPVANAFRKCPNSCHVSAGPQDVPGKEPAS